MRWSSSKSQPRSHVLTRKNKAVALATAFDLFRSQRRLRRELSFSFFLLLFDGFAFEPPGHAPSLLDLQGEHLRARDYIVHRR